MRAAVVGGAGYMAGKKAAAGRQAEAEQNARIDQLEQQQAPPAPPPSAPAPPAPPAAGESDTIAQLKQLADLHSAGALSDEEFAAAKAKVLG
jgi:hypothetical protein